MLFRSITYSQIQSGAYALVLSEEHGKKRIPIIIGTAEAQSIAVQLENLKPPRPLTHDLLVSFTKAFNANLKEVFIYKFEDGVFSSEIIIEDSNSNLLKIDSRTSDAIAFALRTEAMITTTADILERAGVYFDEDMEELEHSPAVKPGNSKQVEELNDQLREAIEKEDYELASRVRDQLKKLKDDNNE